MLPAKNCQLWTGLKQIAARKYGEAKVGCVRGVTRGLEDLGRGLDGDQRVRPARARDGARRDLLDQPRDLMGSACRGTFSYMHMCI